MRVAIVGAGFVGLTAGLRLADKGVEVSLFEAENSVGGLASGFSVKGWGWPVERFYHHIFTNDAAIIRLAREVDWPPVFFKPTTSIYARKTIYPFSTALDLIRFPHLPVSSKLRMGLILGFLKFFPFWKLLERLTTEDLLRSTMGSLGYTTIWEPLLVGKFGAYASSVNAAWFWARVQKRTARLGYFHHGFQGLANRMADTITKRGGRVFLGHPIQAILPSGRRLSVRSALGSEIFDRVVVTASTPLFLQLVCDIPDWYKNKLKRLSFVDALVVVLVLAKPYMEGVYWLNVTDRCLPFLVMVEHTNMISSRHYGGNHLLYLGAYLPPDHRLFSCSKSRLRHLAVQQLQVIRGKFDPQEVLDCFVFRGTSAQPIVPAAYSEVRPSITTPLPHLFLGNMDLVYPWDRGTNYAVELGETVAQVMLKQ